MLVLAFLATVAAQQDAPVVDAPVYASSALGVSLPRPFDDWVFAPATERGTTTIIFQPRAGTLSDQLWGALVLAPWGGDVPLGAVAERRITGSWRQTLGPSFRILQRDTVRLDGVPALHTRMSGAINLAVVEVEEYLAARDSELVVLQLRYPRGPPRDSIAAGYARVVAGLRLRRATADQPTVSVSAPVAAAATPWVTTMDHDAVSFDLPEQLRAVAPGSLAAEGVLRGRRSMRFVPAIGPADTALYAVGRFHVEVRRIGRLTVRLWRSDSPDASISRARDPLIAAAADAWAHYWRALGPVPVTEIALVETAWPQTRGAPATIFLGADADSVTVARELSRTWWGGVVHDDSTTGTLISDALPEWSLSLLDPLRLPPPAITAARAAAGEPRFREAIRTFVAESRGQDAALSALFLTLGDSASAPLRGLIR